MGLGQTVYIRFNLLSAYTGQATNTACVSGLVARGQWGGNREPTAYPTG